MTDEELQTARHWAQEVSSKISGAFWVSVADKHLKSVLESQASHAVEKLAEAFGYTITKKETANETV